MESSKIPLPQDMKPQEEDDVTEIIQKMSRDPRYDDAIRQLGSINFFVIYFTNNQLHLYREYLCTMGEKAEISIDATGKFIKEFDLFEGKKTGQICLYTATINVGHKTVPVSQTITEIHDSGFVTFWLDCWLQAGIKAPPQAISDYGRAILLGMCRSFNYMSLTNYIDSCFQWANTSTFERQNTRPAKTIIRVNFAHVMALVARWDCIKNTRHPDVKRFFLRTVALMIDCQEIKEFERVFTLTCAVVSHPYENHLLNISTQSISVKEARIALIKLMSTKEMIISDLEETIGSYEERAEDIPDQLDEFMDSDDDVTLTHKYIKGLIANVQPREGTTKLKGDVNAYFLPDFIEGLERLGKEFPLWTAAAIPCPEKHASSAYEEGYFGSMRRMLNTTVRLPTTANRFLHEHLTSINTGTIEVASNLKHVNHLRRKLPTPFLENSPLNLSTESHDDSDFLPYEEWGGFSKKNKWLPLSEENSIEYEVPPKSNCNDQSATPEISQNSSVSAEGSEK